MIGSGVKIFTLKMPTPIIKERTSKENTAYTRGQEVRDTQSRRSHGEDSATHNRIFNTKDQTVRFEIVIGRIIVFSNCL